jgi:uncharacterized protein (TIGR02145 family)
MKKIILIILLFTYYSCGFSQQTSTFTDTRDGKTYKTVKIGNQVWMAENLAFKTDSGSWPEVDTGYVTKYGYLYNRETAKNVCPAGWHLPSKDEFETLINNPGDYFEAAYRYLIPGGSSGFSAPLGGSLNCDGSFVSVGESANFWSSSPEYNDDDFAWSLYIASYRSRAYVGISIRSCGFSVRCLKNN